MQLLHCDCCEAGGRAPTGDFAGRLKGRRTDTGGDLLCAQGSDWSSALYKALEHAQRTLQTKIEELHVQRSRLGAHDDLIEVTKKNVAEESNQLQTELKAKIGEVRDARSVPHYVCQLSANCLQLKCAGGAAAVRRARSFGRCWTSTNLT